MKKIASFMAILIMSFALFACKAPSDAQEKQIYQAAINAGFNGTYEEWLEQIKGLPGKDGREIELSLVNNKIVWRYKDTNSWTEIYDINDLIGPKGEDGISITKIEKTSTEGLVDTYTIYYSDKTTSTFTITNGKDGTSIEPGDVDASHMPNFKIGTNGNWFVGDIDTGAKAQGPKGDTGLSAYEIYLKYHPEYKKTEEEWLDDLVNGRLKDDENVKIEIVSLAVSYEVGDPFKGGKLRVTTGGKSEIIDITLGMVKNFSTETAGTRSITITYRGQSITESITVTAPTVETYTITYNLNGGTLNTPKIEYEYLAPVSLPTPEKANHKFLGWYLDNKKVTFTTYEFKKNITLEARWEEIINSQDNFTIADSFSHTFTKGEFSNAGGTINKLNGLKLSYDATTYIGFDNGRGIQIGSSNSPVSNYKIVLTLPAQVEVTDYELVLSKGGGGISSYGIQIGNYSKENEIALSTDNTISDFDLTEKTSTVTITLNATAKAVYLKSIGLSVLKKDNSFDLTVDGQAPNPDSNPGGGNDGGGNDSGGESVSGTPVKPGVNGILNTKYQPITLEAYYKNTDLNLTKEALRAELNGLVSTMTKYSYGDSRNTLPYTDEDLTHKGQTLGIYNGELFEAKWDSGKTWNREHVWACNHMWINVSGDNYRPENSTRNHASDLHNLRVCQSNLNSTRSDNLFSETVGDRYFDPMQHETFDSRGDVARILFYMYVRYNELHLRNDLTDPQFSMGILNDLLRWNKLDPVDDFEIQRNNRVYEYQGNRNPFIDYPNLADKLF